ncbi:MAG: protein-export chaperone SecB, partial [Caulobacterales bacterium]
MTTLGSGESPPEAPHLRVLAQYVKDFSFQNPMAAESARSHEVQPMIDMGVEVKSRPAGADGENVFEVDLRIHVEA